MKVLTGKSGRLVRLGSTWLVRRRFNQQEWLLAGGRNSRRCPRAVPVSGLSYIHHHMTIHTMQYGGVFQPTIQFPWLPSLPRALLRCARYLTSITRPALCIPRATRCNNLQAIPNRSSVGRCTRISGVGQGLNSKLT